MTDDRLDALMASMAPISEAQVAELPLSGPEADLMEALMSTPRTDPTSSRTEPSRPDGAPTVPYLSPAPAERTGRRARLVLAVVAAAAAVLFAAVLWPSTDPAPGPGDDVDVSVEPPATEPADDLPWILLDQPGWALTDVDTFGQTIFSDGSHRLTVGLTTYLPASPEAGFLKDPPGAIPVWDHLPPRQVLGHEAALLQSKEEREGVELPLGDPAGTDAFVAQWNVEGPDGGVTGYRVTGDLPTAELFFQLLDGLHYVDADTFAAAVPDSYVLPVEQPAVIDELLTDVPRPDGYDPGALAVENRGVGQKRRDLVDTVAISVACGWADAWVAATDAGDGAAAGQAVDALRALLDAPIIDEMAASPSYYQVLDHYPVMVEEFADAMAEGRPVTLTGQGPGLAPIPGQPYPVRDVRETLLGCFRVPGDPVEPPVDPPTAGPLGEGSELFPE